MVKFLIFIFLIISTNVFAQNYEVKLHIKNLPEDAQPMLLRIYNGNMYILDSTAVQHQGNVTFTIPDSITPGMLRSILGMPAFSQYSNGQPVSFDFIFNRENIEFNLDFKNPVQSLEVVKSDENRIYFDFQKSDALFFQKLGLLEQVVLNYPDKDDFYQKALEYYRKFQIQRDKFIDKTFTTHSNTLAGRIIKNQKIPLTAGDQTPQQRDSIFRSEFLKQIDFNDTTLLYTNVYTDKVFRYIQMFMQRDASPRENEANCIRALDQIVPLMNVNPTIQQHILQFLITGFESMRMEEVLAHISSNYLQQCGSSSEIIKRRLEGYSKMAIGQKVPDFTVTDIQGTPVNLYNNITPYTLILFWHTGCGHCQILMNQLPALSEKGFFSDHQIKVIGISIDESKEDWEKFSADYKLDWTNTHTEGGFESLIANDYNLFATPTMFLIDSDHNIIAKPTTLGELEKNITELK